MVRWTDGRPTVEGVLCRKSIGTDILAEAEAAGRKVPEGGDLGLGVKGLTIFPLA
ncbi:hypothetical protein ZHAS_00009490 [Anopheles sinensis]|uniref:Uncharacterized protein n=1 Tax=Anopheles sinensis TaxID=74873 RepID=A0A084VVD3_ANOSI|nr:hypothetical protein ZHAS_00009490 [Anopheles sinensis]